MEFTLNGCFDEVDGAPSKRKTAEADGSYGSVQSKLDLGDPRATKVLRAYALLQQGLPYLLGCWFLWSVGHRVFTMLHGQSASQLLAPSPAPGGSAFSRPSCAAYTYPQCEQAMLRYLLVGVKDRCEAFERVKAEGDVFQYPYQTDSQVTCAQPGCCGCPGQCSKCPPMLPGCSSWHLDGAWGVAFSDGTEANYRFDAHGHCEMTQPASSLPLVWKSYDGAYVPQGSDLVAKWATVQEALALCQQTTGCRSIVFDANTQTPEGKYYVFLKTIVEIVFLPGATWRSYINEERPKFIKKVAVAGPLTEVGTGGQTFRLDLHLASPHLFPEGSADLISVRNGELYVQRLMQMAYERVNGTGLHLPSDALP